jgi:rhodanese-related sulfurtransferase
MELGRPKIFETMKSKYLLIIVLFMNWGCASKVYKQANVEQLEPKAYLARLEATETAYLLDIRTGMEYKKAHIDSAQNVNFLSFSFGKKINELDTSKTVFIYCHTAHRSPFVAKKLWKRGFHQVVDLKGGFRALKKEIKGEQLKGVEKVEKGGNLNPLNFFTPFNEQNHLKVKASSNTL